MSSGVLSSSGELNDSCLHTGLGGACSMFHGVTGLGSNEACLMLETWWILGVFLSGVGKLIVSEPLSQPSSASAHRQWKATFSAIMKQPNNILSDC